MQQVTPHIMVVAHTVDKAAPDRAGALSAEGATPRDFAQLLAGQIEAKPLMPSAELTVPATPELVKKPIQLKDLAVTAEAVQTPAAATADVPVAPLLQQVIDALAQQPLPHLPAQVEKMAKACCETVERGSKAQAASLEPLSLPTADAKPAIDLAAVPAKVEEEPAKFAALQQAVKNDVAELKPMAETKIAPQVMHAPAQAPMQPHQVAQPAPAAAQPHVAIPVADKGWDNAFAQRVVWLANNHQQSAQLHVTPPNLGPVEIRISMNGDQTSAVFVSPHASVREAIESALPRLREMFSESGLTLGNVNVTSQHQQQQQHAHQQRQGRGQPQFDGQGTDIAAVGVTNAGVANVRVSKDGLVDIFA